MFAGAYDEAPGRLRPVYGALNFRQKPVGAAPRFGSAYLRLTASALARATFCYPDSHLEPTAFAVAERMSLIEVALADDQDDLDDYIEAQVHGPVQLDRDVEALVLDPSYRGTDVETAARRVPCRLEWHPGFRLSVTELRRHPDYRGSRYVDLGAAIAVDGRLTPRNLLNRDARFERRLTAVLEACCVLSSAAWPQPPVLPRGHCGVCVGLGHGPGVESGRAGVSLPDAGEGNTRTRRWWHRGHERVCAISGVWSCAGSGLRDLSFDTIGATFVYAGLDLAETSLFSTGNDSFTSMGRMLLDDMAGEPDALRVWLHAERFAGAGSRDYSSFSQRADVSREYHPQLGGASFELATFWVPDAEGAFLRNAMSSELLGFYREDGRFLLPVHPDVAAMKQLPGMRRLGELPAGPRLTVSPTANTRTVAVLESDGEPVAPHFVKLHFPRALSRFTRRLRRPIITLQLWVSEQLSNAGVPGLREVGGGVLGTDPAESWGYLIREAVADNDGGRTRLLPLFALYGEDLTAPDDAPLLVQLIERAGTDPGDYVTTRLVEPMVRLWLRVVTDTGCVPEMHGQNTLVSFDDGYDDPHIVYRDCGIYVDPALREPGPLPPVNILGADITADSAQVRSLAYDSFMGHHVLDRVAHLAEQRFEVPAAVLHKAAREVFHEAQQPRVTMPATVHYYDDEATRTGQGWRLRDTGQPPPWR